MGKHENADGKAEAEAEAPKNEQIVRGLIQDFFFANGLDALSILLEQRLKSSSEASSEQPETSIHRIVDRYISSMSSGVDSPIDVPLGKLTLEDSAGVESADANTDASNPHSPTKPVSKRAKTPPYLFYPPQQEVHASSQIIGDDSAQDFPDADLSEIPTSAQINRFMSGFVEARPGEFGSDFSDELESGTSQILAEDDSFGAQKQQAPLPRLFQGMLSPLSGDQADVSDPFEQTNEMAGTIRHSQFLSESVQEELTADANSSSSLPYFVPADQNVRDEWVDDNDCGYRVLRYHNTTRNPSSVKGPFSIRDMEDKDVDEEEKDENETRELYSAQIACEDPISVSTIEKRRNKELIERSIVSADLSDEDPEYLRNLYQLQSTVLESMSVNVIYEADKTGFEPTEDFDITIGRVIAARYQILEYIGSAAFSRAIKCLDLSNGYQVCLKVIRNNKSFIDQTFDEFKILRKLNLMDPEGRCPIVRCYDCFYYKEHLFLVTELLKSNLYDLFTYHHDSGYPNYFTIPRLRRITRQLLSALSFIHSIDLIHCDLKPENILMQSISRCVVKLIDFGSSCYTTDFHTSYVQSRSYRAPEVVLGCPYGKKVDIWSLGCILAELYTGYVLFQNISINTMIGRIISILGPIPPHMVAQGQHSSRMFNKDGLLFEHRNGGTQLKFIFPKKSSLAHRLRSPSETFLDFVHKLLEIDPAKRPTAVEAFSHPWLSEMETEEEYYYDLIAVQQAYANK